MNQGEAILMLYEAVGFHRVDAPPDFPEALKSEVVFLEMALGPRVDRR